MFKAGDYLLNVMNMSRHVDIIYRVLKVHKRKGTLQLYDIINIKNNMIYHRVPLPNDFYIKLEMPEK